MFAIKKEDRFEKFYNQQSYITLKNDLYNYRLRKAAVSRYLNTQKPRAILEAGSGFSPVSNKPDRTVFTDLSFQALAVLQRMTAGGKYVVADCCRLPFKTGVFSHTISSEVLEHIPDDRSALFEMARVTVPFGRLVVTFPHRKCYFSNDDRYVGHFRRYEYEDMQQRLRVNGFCIEKVEKLLGPLEKAAMLTAVFLYERLQKRSGQGSEELPVLFGYLLKMIFRGGNTLFMALVWLEAKLLPLSFSTVLMIVGCRNSRPPSN
jgi:SAM-dependent methyltransferase